MKNKYALQIWTLGFFIITMALNPLNGQPFEETRICQCSKKNHRCASTKTARNFQKNNGAGSLGLIQANTNLVLPSSYNFQEYVYAEPNDQGTCLGQTNTTAAIEAIYLSQTHRYPIGHPFLFTIGERPALLQLAVTGSGPSPDVQVEGQLNGNSLGVLCLNGPTDLSSTINLNQANMDEYFSVTLPKSWIKIGLELIVTAGNVTQVLTQSALNVRPYTELNLVQFDIDIMDYNHLPHRTPVFDKFLEELASALPVSVVRVGHFPTPIRMPSVASNNEQGVPKVVHSDSELEDNNLNTGYMSAAGHSLLGRIQQATGDFANTIYFGNILNLDPGGWGFEGNFVSYDFTDVFIHELGHALSMPHWNGSINCLIHYQISIITLMVERREMVEEEANHGTSYKIYMSL